jgi:hypothetical protein
MDSLVQERVILQVDLLPFGDGLAVRRTEIGESVLSAVSAAATPEVKSDAALQPKVAGKAGGAPERFFEIRSHLR